MPSAFRAEYFVIYVSFVCVILFVSREFSSSSNLLCVCVCEWESWFIFFPRFSLLIWMMTTPPNECAENQRKSKHGIPLHLKSFTRNSLVILIHHSIWIRDYVLVLLLYVCLFLLLFDSIRRARFRYEFRDFRSHWWEMSFMILLCAHHHCPHLFDFTFAFAILWLLNTQWNWT